MLKTLYGIISSILSTTIIIILPAYSIIFITIGCLGFYNTLSLTYIGTAIYNSIITIFNKERTFSITKDKEGKAPTI